MEYSTSDTEVIGVVLDLTLRHEPSGRRVLDNVKAALSDFFRRNLEDDDIMYLYHPDIIEPVNRLGAQVAAVSNYETDGWKFDLNLALRQTLFVIAAEPHDSKLLLLVTDRLSDIKPIKKIAVINEKDMLDCNILCLDIGHHLPDLAEPSVRIVHRDTSEDLMGSFKEIIYGENDVCTSCSIAE